MKQLFTNLPASVFTTKNRREMARAPRSEGTAADLGAFLGQHPRGSADHGMGNPANRHIPPCPTSLASDATSGFTSDLSALHAPALAARFPAPLTAESGPSRDVLVALTYGLELVRHGAMLVAAEGRPQLLNRAALAILQKKDGISLARTGLVADRASDTRLLHRLLQDAIASPESGEPKDSPMSLPRTKTPSALIVRVVPGPGLDCWGGPENRTALLKLYDQEMGLLVDERALTAIYGLTKGEAALATRIVQGKSIEEAAAELFISEHTARTHLKRIFMKTDTHRQPELVVRMLLTVL